MFDMVPKTNLWNRLAELKSHFKLRVFVIRLYEKVIGKLRNIECGWKIVMRIWDLSKDVPSSVPFLQYTLTSKRVV